jgi:hypothetical protein
MRAIEWRANLLVRLRAKSDGKYLALHYRFRCKTLVFSCVLVGYDPSDGVCGVGLGGSKPEKVGCVANESRFLRRQVAVRCVLHLSRR